MKAIHESFHSNLSDNLGDPFYQRVSQDWLLMIADYLTTKKGIALNKGNVLVELENFFLEMNEIGKSGFVVYEEICLDKQTDTAFPYMTEETVNKSFSYFKSVIIATLATEGKNK